MTEERKNLDESQEVVLYCTKCYSIYPYSKEGKNEYNCPQCRKSHINSRLVILDKDIAETISILNQKGYITRWSCQGHSMYNSEGKYEGYCNAYISFDGLNMDFVFRQAYGRGYDMNLLAAPDGWHWEQMYVGEKVNYTLYGDDDYSNDEKQPLLMTSIRKWADDIRKASFFTGWSYSENDTVYDWLKDNEYIIGSNMCSKPKSFKEWNEEIGYNSWLSAFIDIDEIKENNGFYGF